MLACECCRKPPFWTNAEDRSGQLVPGHSRGPEKCLRNPVEQPSEEVYVPNRLVPQKKITAGIGMMRISKALDSKSRSYCSYNFSEFAAAGVAPSFSKASRFAFGQIQKSIIGVLCLLLSACCYRKCKHCALGCEQSAASQTIYMGSVNCKGLNLNLLLTSYFKT